MKNLIQLLIFLGFISSCQNSLPFNEETSHLRDSELAPFYHGVASGDPLQDAVILWTRVTPEQQLPAIKIEWEISSTPDFEETRAGSIETSPEKDYTVKIDVNNLESGKTYYYRFKALGNYSTVGKTKTASSSNSEVKFGVVSCSNYEWGYFNAYTALAEENLDAIIHLGDYIYEYAPGRYGDTTLNRPSIPAKELISLKDYRTRYSQYRLDKDLQAAHASHPFINIWDDHEIANNSYKEGAQNHQDDEGSYEVRKAAAKKAFYEWLPIREHTNHYRKFSYGELADLVMLDERLAGRTFIADSLSDPTLQDTTRTMLGEEQLDWFTGQLLNSNARWKVIGNQVIFSYLNWGFPSFNINLDSWDGYPHEQQKIANLIQENSIENVVFITGDTHSAWAFEVTNDPFKSYNPKTSEGAFAIEFGATSINSSNSNETTSDEEVIAHEEKITNSAINPHLKFSNMRDHGYLVLTLSEDKAEAEWKLLETTKERNSKISLVEKMWVRAGEVKLRK